MRNKLFLLFIAIGVLPFLSLLFYVLYLSQTKMVDKLVVEQFERTQTIEKLIENHFSSLANEVKFLSSLDVMDDLLVEDMDKRISRLLTQKAADLKKSVVAFCIDPKGQVLASSTTKNLQKSYNVEMFQGESGEYSTGKKLYLYSQITSSFDSQKVLGTLVFEYNLDNLDNYLVHNDYTHTFIMDKNSQVRIGDSFHKVKINNSEGSFIDKEHVIVYKHLPKMMQNYYIVYAQDKSKALEFVYDFISFMFFVSTFLIVVIVYISLKFSKDVVHPILSLTSTTKEITSTQNYTKQVVVDTKDELAVLGRSFNRMIKTTSNALERLEKENQLRLKRFTQLIEIFNTIIQTEDEKGCIEVSVEQMKLLSETKKLTFVADEVLDKSQEYIKLDVTDFEKDKKNYFGAIALGIASFQDENEQKFYNSIGTMIMLQLDRIRLIERTKAASNAKSAFISSMSHELRTPLNALIGYAQYMISCEELNEEQQDIMAKMESSSQYLRSMINEILDIAKIEAGKMDVELQDVDLAGLLENVYNMLIPLADEKELEFILQVQKGIDTHYKTDPKLFQQIVVNLLSNAIKFTQKGSITINLLKEDEKLIVRIQDTGIGIAKEDLSRLFSEFTQLENTLQGEHKGTGLGLSLSKKMAQLLEGDVKLYSEGIGFGSEAVFSLSLKNL